MRVFRDTTPVIAARGRRADISRPGSSGACLCFFAAFGPKSSDTCHSADMDAQGMPREDIQSTEVTLARASKVTVEAMSWWLGDSLFPPWRCNG